MEAQKCNYCGVEAVVANFETDEAVCEACGAVAEAGLTCVVDTREMSFVEDGPPGEDIDNAARKRLLDKLQGMASMFPSGSKLFQEAELVMNETRKHKATARVDAYCGAVLYIAARRCLLPITHHDIVQTCGLGYIAVLRMYRYLVRAARLCIPGHNLSLLLERFIDEVTTEMDSKGMFPPPPKSTKRQKRDEKAKEKETKERSLFYERPTKDSLIAVMHDVKEYIFHQELHGRVKPMCFVGAVLALAIESKFSQQKAPPIISDFCKRHSLPDTNVRDYKNFIKRHLFNNTKDLPGFQDLSITKMPRRLPKVLTTWKRLQKIKENCVEDEEVDEPVPMAPYEEGVAPTPLVVLLQEAGLIGDLTERKINRGYCPPENYNKTFPKELAKFVTPVRIKIQGLSSSSESEWVEEEQEGDDQEQQEDEVIIEKEVLAHEARGSHEAAGNDDDIEHEQMRKEKHPESRPLILMNFTSSVGRDKKIFERNFCNKYWEMCAVPGLSETTTICKKPVDFYEEGGSPSFKDMAKHFWGKPSWRHKASKDGNPTRKCRKRRKPESGRLNMDVAGVASDTLLGCGDVEDWGNQVECVAAEDEFEREGLSDIDDADIDGYIMRPREIVMRALLAGNELELPLRRMGSSRGEDNLVPGNTLHRGGSEHG